MIEFFPDWLPIELSQSTFNIIFLGVILSVSIFADSIARRTKVPRISILILIGVGIAYLHQLWIGTQNSDLLGGLSEPLIQLALVMVAFLLGNEFKLDKLRNTGSLILSTSIFVILGSGVVVGAGLLALGTPLVVAISLAAISVATDPAAVRESVQKSGNNRLPSKILLGTVAIDDAWGILAYGFSMSFLAWMMSSNGQHALLHAIWELGGAVILGCLIGLPASWLTGRLKQGEPTQVEAIALILLLSGLSTLLGVSALLASMTAGTLVANLASHHKRTFREIEHIEWPFLVFFFVLSGASINLNNMGGAIWLTLFYILFRLTGRLFGGYLAAMFAQKRQKTLPRSIGLALTPQAGVAMGMALLATEQFPEFGDSILPVVVASTIIFELVGPLFVRRVLNT